MLKWEVLVFSFHLYENGRGGRMDGRGTSYYMAMESWEKVARVNLVLWTPSGYPFGINHQKTRKTPRCKAFSTCLAVLVLVLDQQQRKLCWDAKVSFLMLQIDPNLLLILPGV